MTIMSASRRATALLVTAVLAVPGVATARTPTERFVPDGPDAGLYCGKDYTQNPVGGDYCVRLRATVASPQQGVAKHTGTSGSDGRTRLIAALGVLLAIAGGTGVLRRRTAASTSRSHGSPATT